MKFNTSILYFIILLCSCHSKSSFERVLDTDTLKIEKLTDQLYIHTSFLEIPNYGPFPCNGMIYIDENEAIIFDTPTSDSVSKKLINYLHTEYEGLEIKAVVINHFHIDCLGGLTSFHNLNIPSYAYHRCIELARKDSTNIPQNGFDKELILQIGNQTIENRYFGPAHSSDNIVSFIKSEQALFGGCQIKALGASKGNLKDANTDEWSTTVAKIKSAYPNLNIVIPGHGESGGVDLLDYTIELFKSQK